VRTVGRGAAGGRAEVVESLEEGANHGARAAGGGVDEGHICGTAARRRVRIQLAETQAKPYP
jgi:hypothetical protein